MPSVPRADDGHPGLEPPRWEESWSPSGEVLDRLLSAGQFVVTEPDSHEFVCADRRQLLSKLRDCEARSIEPRVRWRRADGTVERYEGHPPSGWGLEDRPPD